LIKHNPIQISFLVPLNPEEEIERGLTAIQQPDIIKLSCAAVAQIVVDFIWNMRRQAV